MLVQAYATMIDRTQEKCYFMWDALKDALILELKEGKQDLVVQLCNLSDTTPSKREILIEVLTEFGEGWPDKAHEMLNRLLQEGHHIDAALVAIEVAYNWREFDVLQQMAQHKDGPVRKAAAQFIYYVWEVDPDRALGILSSLAAQVRRTLIPNLRILDSCANISILILLQGYKDSDSVEAVRKVWTDILDRILFTDWDNVPVVGSIWSWLRESIILRLASSGAWYAIGPIWKTDPAITYDPKDLERFFSQDPEIRHRAARMVSYIDVTSDLDKTWDDFLEVIEGDDYLSTLLVTMVLAAHGLQYDHAITSPKTNPAIPYIERLLDYAVGLEPARPAIPYLLMALSSSGRGYRAETVDDEFLEIWEDCLQKYYTNHGCVSKDSHQGHELKLTGFGFYIQLLYLKDANLDSDFLTGIVQTAFSRDDYDFLGRYVIDIGGVSPGRRVWPALRALQPVLTGLPSWKNERLRACLEKELIEALSTNRIYAPRKVDQFMDTLEEKNETLSRIRRQVEARGRKESIGRMTFGRLIWFIRDGILLNPNKLILNQFIWWLGQAVKSTSIVATISLLIRLIINLVYLPDNRAVFKTPDLLSKYGK